MVQNYTYCTKQQRKRRKTSPFGCIKGRKIHFLRKKLPKNLENRKKVSTFAPQLRHNAVVPLKGEMVEWSITTVLKTVVLRGTGGSNPSLSAFKTKRESCDSLFLCLIANALYLQRSDYGERERFIPQLEDRITITTKCLHTTQIKLNRGLFFIMVRYTNAIKFVIYILA